MMAIIRSTRPSARLWPVASDWGDAPFLSASSPHSEKLVKGGT